MAYPMIDSGVDPSTQGQYQSWQNPTGWSREEATGLYTWIDPVTGDVVQGMQKPMITPGSASSEQTQQPQQQEQPSFLKEANTGIENAWKFEYEKAKREWISAESAYDMGIDVDGSPLPRLGPDTVMRMKEHAYQQFQIKDQELKAHYADLKMKVDQIDKDPYTNEFEKTNAARQLVSPHLPNIPQSRMEGMDTQKLRQQQLETGTVLRKEFQASKAFTNYETIQRSERGMKQAYDISTDPTTKSKVASDQALAVLFQKMLDPGSVVRESEYARTPEGVGLINQIESWIPKLRKGGLKIKDTDRKAIYDMAQRLLDEAKVDLSTHINRYVTLSNLYGIDPRLVLGDIQPFSPSPNEMRTPAEEAELVRLREEANK